jgi:mRNA interferase HigB
MLLRANFESPEAMRAVFPSLDNFKYRDRWWVIDVAGNHLRVIAFIRFEHGLCFVKHIATHAEYDKLCKKYRKS